MIDFYIAERWLYLWRNIDIVATTSAITCCGKYSTATTKYYIQAYALETHVYVYMKHYELYIKLQRNIYFSLEMDNSHNWHSHRTSVYSRCIIYQYVVKGTLCDV